MLKQELKQKQLQKLSPQQIQLIKLLQVPTTKIEERIEEEMESNPALEEGKPEEEERTEDELEELDREEELDKLEDDFDIDDYINDDDFADYKVNNYEGFTGQSQEEENQGVPPTVRTTFHESLLEQLRMLDISEREEELAHQLIGNLDDDGYLRRSIRAISDDLMFRHEMRVEPEELEEVLEIIQSFDPVGVGARDLQECLELQIKQKENSTPAVDHAKTIINHHFQLLSHKKYEKLKKKLDLSSEELKAAVGEIRNLNPKPGSAYTDKFDYDQDRSTEYVVPDFIVRSKNGEPELTLNDRNVPELRVSPRYQEMLKGYKASKKKDKKQKEALLFIKQKIDAAKWFIDAIKQRQQTLLGTMRTIMDFQKEFFLTGDESTLKPMILKDVAKETGLDVSTISRVANQKYVQTEFGTYSLKYFFSEGMTKESGEKISTKSVKLKLKEIIENEDKSKPLSDNKLAQLMKEEGYKIARRTVAKYREQMDIPVARLRKEIQ